MALNTPVDREFAVLPRGHIRDRVVLANFREGLRNLVNPETGQPFTADEIQRATQPGSRWYVGAQAIDDYGQAEQRRALWLADQIRVERASTKWLEGYHARLWGEGKLAATGGSGTVSVPGVPGTLVIGSTTLGATGAYTARDAAGVVYQVLVGGSIEPDGTVEVTMGALGTGAATNPPPNTTLTWVLRDPNMDPTCTVVSQFTGGTPRETDGEQASRIAGVIRHRPGGGNNAQVRGWARGVSNAIDEAFVYPCPFYGNSTLVCITQKRASLGPGARQPSPFTLAQAIAYLTPPLSPVFPPRAFVVVTGFQAKPSDVALRLALQKASNNGWSDATPFPAYHATAPFVSGITSQTDFQIYAPGNATLPGQAPLASLPSGGNGVPNMMMWDLAVGAFRPLSVSAVTDLGGSVFRVQLHTPPTNGVALGQRVSPLMHAARAAIVAQSVVEYFDGLGPGELFDLSLDSRGGRCVRFPSVSEEKPARAGAVVATRVIEALGGASADGALGTMSVTEPGYPTNLVLGPNMITCGQLGVYEF